MRRLFLAGLLLLCFLPVVGQEVLMPSKIQARANKKNMPALGLPIRTDGDIDAIVRYIDGRWEGADSLNAVPRWTMQGADAMLPAHLYPVLELCQRWAAEKPKGRADIVYGPHQGNWFVAICKKTNNDLGWKSIAFMIPHEGFRQGESVYRYSHSVNWLEQQIGYNLYPKLPAHIQEIIEEMTATELLIPFKDQHDPMSDEDFDREIDYDWEEDYRDR